MSSEMVLARKSGGFKRRCPNGCGWSGSASSIGLCNHLRSCSLRTSSANRTPLNASSETHSRTERHAPDNMRADSIEGQSSNHSSKTYGVEHGWKRVAVGTIATRMCKVMRKAGKKDVEEYHKSIIDSGLTMEEVKENVPNTESAKRIVSSMIENSLNVGGFEKIKIESENGRYCEIYKKSLRKVLLEQMRRAKRCDVFTNAEEAIRALGENSKDVYVHSHPMACELGVRSVTDIRSIVEASEDDGVYWHGARYKLPTPDAQFSVRMFQGYSSN